MNRRTINVDAVRQDVRQRVKELREMLDEYEMKMIQELDKRADISSLRERHEIQCANSFQITRLLKFLNAVKDKGSDRDLVQVSVKLCERTDHVLSATINNQLNLDDLRVDITFQPARTKFDTSSLLGTIITSQTTHFKGSTNACHPQDISPLQSVTSSIIRTDLVPFTSPLVIQQLRSSTSDKFASDLYPQELGAPSDSKLNSPTSNELVDYSGTQLVPLTTVSMRSGETSQLQDSVTNPLAMSTDENIWLRQLEHQKTVHQQLCQWIQLYRLVSITKVDSN